MAWPRLRWVVFRVFVFGRARVVRHVPGRTARCGWEDAPLPRRVPHGVTPRRLCPDEGHKASWLPCLEGVERGSGGGGNRGQPGHSPALPRPARMTPVTACLQVYGVEVLMSMAYRSTGKAEKQGAFRETLGLGGPGRSRIGPYDGTVLGNGEDGAVGGLDGGGCYYCWRVLMCSRRMVLTRDWMSVPWVWSQLRMSGSRVTVCCWRKAGRPG